MPYHNYGQLDSEDIKDVIVYIRNLQPIENHVPQSESDFSMNFILNTIPSKANLHKKPSPADTVAYGKYLITAAACVDCHTPFEKGKLIATMMFDGGRTFQTPGGTVTSANLTPDAESGIGKWTRKDFMDRFAFFRDSANAHRKIDFAKDFNTPMP
jgi:hypothetical protein